MEKKFKNFNASNKQKFTKKEKDVFVDKTYLIILTFPMKYINNRKINSLAKRHKDLNLSICFSKNAVKNTFYHCFFRPEDFFLETYKDIMTINSPLLINLFKDIEYIKKQLKTK